MSDAQSLQYFSIVLIGYVFSALARYIYIWNYNRKGIIFLQNAREIIFNRNDKEEFDKITNDLPALINLMPELYVELFITFLVLSVNMLAYLFALVPESQLTLAWTMLTYMSSFGTAYILLSAHDSENLTANINIICSSYNLILESYNHIDEYKEKDDDSTDGL